MKTDVIKAANEAVSHSTGKGKTSVRGTYEKISPDKQAMVAKYACQHGNRAAAQHFSNKLNITLKESSVSTWYLAEVNRKVKNREASDVDSLPMKKRG